MHIRLLTTILLMSLALAACSLPPAAQAPTAPAATAEPRATASPRAQAASAVPTATSPEAAIRAAIDRTVALRVYGMRFTTLVTSTLESGQTEAKALIDLEGTFKDADMAYQVRGEQALAPGSEPRAVEVIVVGGQTYAHGPLPLAGADQAVWYAFGTNPPAGLPSATPATSLLGFMTKRAQLTDFAPAGTEQIEGQTCARYRGGAIAALRAFDGMGTPTTAEAKADEATPVELRASTKAVVFDDAVSAAWATICPDGYLYRLGATLAGAPRATPQQRFASSMQLDIRQPNGAITITPPENPVTLNSATAELTATVFNGGNVREQPTINGRVLDQINAHEQVALLAKTADGRWYRITNPRGVTGWVSVTLLTIDPAVVRKVPVAAGS